MNYCGEDTESASCRTCAQKLHDGRERLRHQLGPSTLSTLDVISSSNSAQLSSQPRPRSGSDPDPGTVDTLNTPGHQRHLQRPRDRLDGLLPTTTTHNEGRSASPRQNIGNLLDAQDVTWGWSRAGPPPGAMPPATRSARPPRHHRRRRRRRLHPAPRAVPVTGPPPTTHAPAVELGSPHQAPRSGQPPARPVRLLQPRSPTGTSPRSLPEGDEDQDGHPATPTRWKTDVPREHHQPDRALRIGVHGRRDHLGRLRRLVRPPGRPRS